jgi:hypothetical protein
MYPRRHTFHTRHRGGNCSGDFFRGITNRIHRIKLIVRERIHQINDGIFIQILMQRAGGFCFECHDF